MNIQDLNTGSGKGFHAVMTAFAIAKFGENRSKGRFGSWEPCCDDYANKLLDHFVGVTTSHYGNVSCRLFLRALLAKELGLYLLTGVKTEGLLNSVKEIDKMYWSEGNRGSLQTLALTYL